MTKEEKLSVLDTLLLDTYIEAMKNGQLKAMELGPIVAYLKMNKQVQEKKIHNETEFIEGLVNEEI